MGLIKKIDDLDKFKKGLNESDLAKMVAMDKELSPSQTPVKLGKEWFSVESFDMTGCMEFSKFQAAYREILKANPEIKFDELLQGEDSIVRKIVDFLHVEIDVSVITYKQFKYLMWVITKNYVFTTGEDSEFINQMTPFYFV